MTKNSKELLVEYIKSSELIEISLRQSIKELEEMGVRPEDTLIDSEGFPRGDINLHKVCTLRSSIAREQNDHKEIMKRIEVLLPLLIPSSANNEIEIEISPVQLLPFAKIGIVPTECVAFKAGVCTNDLVVKFGGLNKDTFQSKNLNEFREEFERLKLSGQELEIKLKRGGVESYEIIKLDSSKIDSLGCQILLLQ